MRVLVTGRTGYECSVIRAPGQRPALACLVDNGVRDISALRAAAAGCDAVCHCSNLAHVVSRCTPDADFREMDVAGAVNTVRAGLELGVRTVVSISSVSVYSTHDDVSVAE
jgi:nucleoside-diphosphate-sugar epimerase